MKTEEILNKLHSIEKLILKQHYKPLNLVEAADYLSISQSHLYKLTRRKKIPCHKPSGKYLYFFRDELDEWVKNNEQCTMNNGQSGEVEKTKHDTGQPHETPQKSAGQVINTKAFHGVKKSPDGIKKGSCQIVKTDAFDRTGHSIGQGFAITLDTDNAE